MGSLTKPIQHQKAYSEINHMMTLRAGAHLRYLAALQLAIDNLNMGFG